MQSDKWKLWHTVAVSSVVGLLCYLNSLSADFVYDDSRAIVKNSDLLPSTPWSSVLFNDFWGTPLTHSGSHKSYRPLCVTSFRINYYVGGLNPFGYHLVNVLLHTTVCWLVVILSYTLVHAHFPSLVAGLLFAVHPIHTGKIDTVC
ncbi:Protein O-mannosyl-transferase tmtc2 [Porites harrisoni]